MVTSTLSVYGTKATQSGIYKCIFYYTADSVTFPIASNDAFIVIQGIIIQELYTLLNKLLVPRSSVE